METRKMNAEELIRSMIEVIGDDPNRIGLQDTPRRVITSWKELFRGYNVDYRPKITTFPNGTDGIKYDQMIVDSGKFYSHCEHHMIPFFGHYYFAYIPALNGHVLGLSKVARVIEYYSARLQVQERLVQQVVDDLWNALKTNAKGVEPVGMGLIMKGTHMCKCMRGVKNEGIMVTSDLKGALKTNPAAREEFLALINTMKND
jgi:GTP cyclohydrolase I